MTGPAETRRPLECKTPETKVTTSSTVKTRDAEIPERFLMRPRRTMTDFQGLKKTSASPATPWAMTTERAQLVPKPYASAPVANATKSTPRRDRFVMREGTRPNDEPGRALIERSAAVMRLL